MKRLFALIPLIVLLLASCGIRENISEEVSNYRTRFSNFRTRLLDSITDRDDNAFRDMIHMAFEAIDEKDKEELTNLFSVNIINDNLELGSQIEAFFEVYNGPMEIEEIRYSTSGEEYVEHGKRRTELYNSYGIIIIAGGIRYHIRMSMYSRDDFDKKNEGIHWLDISTEDAYNSQYFVPFTKWNSEPGFYYQDSIEKRNDIMWIEGQPWRYTPYDRTLTSDDLLAVVEKNDDFQNFVTIIGEPNCSWTIYEYYYYELKNGLFAVVKIDQDLRPKDYSSNGKTVKRNLYKPNAIVAIYIADEKSNLETIWMADDIVMVLGRYHYYVPTERNLSEDFFRSFASKSSRFKQLTNEIGMPDIDGTGRCYYELSDNRFIECVYSGDTIERFSVVNSKARLYTIWEKRD